MVRILGSDIYRSRPLCAVCLNHNIDPITDLSARCFSLFISSSHRPIKTGKVKEACHLVFKKKEKTNKLSDKNVNIVLYYENLQIMCHKKTFCFNFPKIFSRFQKIYI